MGHAKSRKSFWRYDAVLGLGIDWVSGARYCLHKHKSSFCTPKVEIERLEIFDIILFTISSVQGKVSATKNTKMHVIRRI